MRLTDIQMESIAEGIRKWHGFKEYLSSGNPIDVIMANMYDGGDEEILEVPEEYVRHIVETSFGCIHSEDIESIQAGMPEFTPIA